MSYEELPDVLPIFPLHGVLLLPGGRLPLNIFEPRYLAMFDDALRGLRMIGMIQPRENAEGKLYTVGCAGKIVSFSETLDGRYEVMLKGISRFEIGHELSPIRGYRRIMPIWESYKADSQDSDACLGLEREPFKDLLQRYFAKQGMECDWQAIDEASDDWLMTCLVMACPLKPIEKQALLEEKCCQKRAQMFMTLLEMEVCS